MATSEGNAAEREYMSEAKRRRAVRPSLSLSWGCIGPLLRVQPTSLIQHDEVNGYRREVATETYAE
mgnify:CR=1 FL=1